VLPDRKPHAQTILIGAEIVNAAQQIYAGLKGLWLAYQGTRTTCQATKTFAKGGSEAFNIGRIDTTASLRLDDKPFDHHGTSLGYASFNGQYFTLSLINHLHNGDIWQRDFARRAKFAAAQC
jgi:hypothetical protein